MKSACLVMLTLFVSLSSVCENLKESNSLQDRKKLSFVDDELLLNDMEKETQFIDSVIRVAKMFPTKSTSEKKSNTLHLNSREQAIKFFKYLNTAVASNGKLRFVFWDKSSHRIVDLSMREKDTSIFVKFNRDVFRNKLRNEDIDFKLLKNYQEVYGEQPKALPISKNKLSDSLLITKSDNGGDEVLEPTDTMVEKQFFEATGIDHVLGGVTELCTQLLWYKKVAYPGFVLKNPYPGIEEHYTFFTQNYFGSFYPSADGFSYQESSKKIVGHIMGRYTVEADFEGIKAGTNFKIEAKMEIDMDNNVMYKASSSFF